MLTRRARVLCLLAGGGAGLAGCATPEEQAADGLKARLDADHDGHSSAGPAPYSIGAAALEALDPYGDALETTTGPGSVSLAVPISVRRIDGGGLSYRETSLGACIRIVVAADPPVDGRRLSRPCGDLWTGV